MLNNIDKTNKLQVLTLIDKLFLEGIIHEPAVSIAKRAVEGEQLSDHDQEVYKVTVPLIEKYYYHN